MAGLYTAQKLAGGNAEFSFKPDRSCYNTGAEEQKLQVLLLVALLRQVFQMWAQSSQEYSVVEEIQVLTLSAFAQLELAQRSLCHLVQGLIQVSSPYSEACGSQCCSLRSAERFHPQFLLSWAQAKAQLFFSF